jgi:shikimate kinase
VTAVPVRCVALLGPRGAGKTTLAPVLARALGWTAADGDELLAARAGVPAGTFLQQAGEERFRLLEEEVTAAALAGKTPQVLALGGGAVLRARVQAALREPFVLPVLLLAPLPVLVSRLRAAPRPSLTSLPPAAEIELLLHERLPLYRSLGKVELDTSVLDAESCAQVIVAVLRS